MHLVHPPHIAQEHPGHVDLSFRSPTDWLDLPPPASTGGQVSLLLLGHETDGPFMVLAATDPTEEDAPRGPAHGHESDTWRISLIGASPMGNEQYGPGEFRWQIGGRSYGADGYASGAAGGYHLVMFGDRRGFATQPVKKELTEHFAERDAGVATMFGIDMPAEYPLDARGMVTTLGAIDKAGKVNGSFADAAGWTELAPGVRGSAGVMGHHEVGPMLLLVRAEAGREVQPAQCLDTEVLVMVVAGSCSIGDVTYEQGDVRIQLPGEPLPAVTAGDQGADVCVVVADRSALTGNGSMLDVELQRLVAQLV